MKKLKKISLDGLNADLQNQALTKSDLLRLRGGYSVIYTGCSTSTDYDHDCTDNNTDE